jgi:thymidine kinase
MFIEKASGQIEVICGSMFSGKTEELIRRLKRAEIAKQKIKIFKPAIDKRYHETDVVSHDKTSIQSISIDNVSDILTLVEDARVVGIDEVQFMDMEIVNVCNTLANRGVRVIVAGLDMDYAGNPFGPMSALMSIAEYVSKVHAICTNCGDLANYSYRLDNNSSLILLGETEKYKALCRQCFKELFQNES